MNIGTIHWWSQQFGHTVLAKVALDILSISPSAGAAERNWSTFGYIHSKSRNRLRNPRVDKLVYIYTNANLLNNIQRQEVWFNEEEAPEVEDCPLAAGDADEASKSVAD